MKKRAFYSATGSRVPAFICACTASLLILGGCDTKEKTAQQAVAPEQTQQESQLLQSAPPASKQPAAKQEPVIVTMPDWESPVWALGANGYYVEVNAPAGIAEFFIEPELYTKGARATGFPRIIGNGSVESEIPLRLNLAVYFQEDASDATKLKGTRVTGWGKKNAEDGHPRMSRSNFSLNKQDLDLTQINSYGVFNTPIPASGRTPLFYIISAGRELREGDAIRIASGETPEELIARNPEANILIFYMRTKADTTEAASAQAGENDSPASMHAATTRPATR